MRSVKRYYLRLRRRSFSGTSSLLLRMKIGFLVQWAIIAFSPAMLLPHVRSTRTFRDWDPLSCFDTDCVYSQMFSEGVGDIRLL